MLRHLARRAAALLSLSLLAAPLLAQDERRFSDEELASLARGLEDWRAAQAAASGREEARAALLRSLDALRVAHQGTDPLAHPVDLARAAWLSIARQTRQLKPGKVVEDELRTGVFATIGMEYAYRLPAQYDPSQGAYPLILAIGDEDERPADHLREDWALREFREGAIVLVPAMPAGDGDWAQVTIQGRPGGMSRVLSALRLSQERFAVDPQHVFVAGSGRGVAVAMAIGDYAPQRFAGIVGRGGEVAELGPDNFHNLPTLLVGGGARTRTFAEAAQRAGRGNCTSVPEGQPSGVWSWMLAHPRDPAPTSLTLAIGDPFPTRVHWLRLAPIASDARLEASIEREQNAIAVEGAGFSHLTLYLNDALLDLDRPVTLSCNGVSATADLRRHLPTTLGLLRDGTSDAGCVYVTQAVFDVERGTLVGVGRAPVAADAEFEQRLAAAGGDPGALWNLHRWCVETERPARSRAVLRRIVRLEPDHALARQALGHAGSADNWFKSEGAQRRYERSQEPERAAALGLVEHKGRWMHRDERPLASKGRVKEPESGQWLTPAERERLDAGWVRQDLEWISPEEAARRDEGLWRVDGEWLGLEAADLSRARIEDPWVIPSTEVLLFSTVERATSLRAIEAMGRALDELRRVFGTEPVLPLRVGLLRDEEQFDRFAMGEPDGRRAPAHGGRLHVVHSAFFAESYFPMLDGERTFGGMGVGLWDPSVPSGDLFGVHSARLAVGLSFVDALDPSPKAVRRALKKGPQPEHHAAYAAEKRLPAWLRYGGAVYAERYFQDDTVATDGDPWWARNWSLDNLRRAGDLRSLEAVFAFELDPDRAEDGRKLLLEAGLLVAFALDGGCAPVMAAHEDLKRALVNDRLHPNQIQALEKALLEHEDELRTFAGL